MSEGGTEESVLRVIDVATGEVVDGPIDRARYSPVAWLPGGEAFYYVRRLAPELVPDGEEQFHRRVWLHRVGTDPDEDVVVFGEGREPHRLLRRLGQPRRSLAQVVRRRGHRAAQRPVARRPLERSAAGAARSDRRAGRTSTRRPGCEVGRDGTLYVFTDLDAPRGRLCVTDPPDPSRRHWADLLPEDPTAVLEGFAILDGPELDRPGAAGVLDPARGVAR